MVLLLTLEQYNAQKKYRNAEIPATSQPDAMTQDLLDRGLICMLRNKRTMHFDCDATYLKTFWVLTPLGLEAIEEFEDNARKVAEERTKETRDRKFEICLMIFSVVLTALIGLLIDIFR